MISDAIASTQIAVKTSGMMNAVNHGAAVKAVDSRPGAEKGVLRGILCQGDVAQQPQADVEDGALVPIHKLVEGVQITPLRRAD